MFENLDLYFNSLDTDLIPQINDIGKNVCDTPIQIRDISEAINEFKFNKAPGNDGLTTEFYK